MKTIAELQRHFITLPKLAQDEIKGGTGGVPLTNAQLQKLFNYTSIGGFTSAAAQVFNTEIEELASTSLGSAVLYELLSKAPTTGSLITLTDTSTNPQALGFYNSGTKTLDFTSIAGFNISDPVHDARAFDLVAHEIFHAWDNIYMGNPISDSSSSEATIEINAFLFSGFTAAQRDIVTGDKDGHYYNDGPGADLSGVTTAAQKAYAAAYTNIVLNHQFNLTNYDTLITDFKSVYTNSMYAPLKTDLPTSFTNNDLYNLVNKPPVISNVGGGTVQTTNGGVEVDNGPIVITIYPDGSSSTTTTTGNSWHWDSKIGAYVDDYGNITNDPNTPVPAPPPPPADTPSADDDPSADGSGDDDYGGGGSSGGDDGGGDDGGGDDGGGDDGGGGGDDGGGGWGDGGGYY